MANMIIIGGMGAGCRGREESSQSNPPLHFKMYITGGSTPAKSTQVTSRFTECQL